MRILNTRLTPLDEYNLPETQFSFMLYRRTTDIIHAVKQLQEKYQEQRQQRLIDLTKTFESAKKE